MNAPSSKPVFTPSQQQKAAELKARILSGEHVPLEELIALLKSAEAAAAPLVKEQFKPSDVDFF